MTHFLAIPNGNDDELACFRISNFESVSDRDPDVEAKLEKTLGEAGALVTRLDYPSQELCVIITDRTVSAESLLPILTRFGYQAEIKEAV